jgi:hypothetical protein
MANGIYKITEDFEKALSDYTGAPYVVTVDNQSNALFLALMYENIKGKVNVYSSISKELMQSYDLDYIPQKVSFIDDGRMILVLGFNRDKESFLTKIDLKTKEVLLQKSLGADVLSARTFAFNRDESLLMIPSLENKLMSVIDLKNLELLKKIETEAIYDKLISL